MKCLIEIKEKLIEQIYNNIDNLSKINAEEMGEVIDMIKDIDESIYYYEVTKAMKKSTSEKIKESSYSNESAYYGISPEKRKIYLESKEQKNDRAIQVQNLKHYLNALMSDITHIIDKGVSAEEIQIMKQGIIEISSKL